MLKLLGGMKMRANYEINEDIGLRKSHQIFQSKVTKIAVIALIFVMLCGACFNLVYAFSLNNIEKSTNNSNINKNNAKIFLIEQKLRKDLSKMKANN